MDRHHKLQHEEQGFPIEVETLEAEQEVHDDDDDDDDDDLSLIHI